MIPLSTQPIRFVAPWRADEADAPVYFIRPGNVVERETLEAELAGDHRAGRVYDFELLEEYISGVSTLLVDDPEHLQLIELAQAKAGGQELPLADAQAVAAARDVLAEHWPPYRRLVAQAERRRTIAPMLVFRRFVVGWEGLTEPWRRGPDGMVHLAALAAVPPLELRAAGNHAYGLLYAGSQAGNSSAPSKSDDGQQISTSDEPSAKAGSSKASGGRKTRASRSRRASSGPSTSG